MTREEAIKILSTRDAHGVVRSMSDLIKREDALNVVCKDWCSNKTGGAVCGRCEDVQSVLAIPSAKAEWIPVSERLPDNPKDVLTTLSNGMVCIGRHHSFDKWTFEAASIMVAFPEEAVVAWMPLPEPYREDGEEDV